MTLHRVASVGEVAEDAMKHVEVEGTPICLAHADDGNWYAINDICSHEEFELCEGELWGTSVECPQHGSRFDLRTGRPNMLPAVEPVPVYPVKVENDEVYVDL
jgi:3-phenylpropionate/trans-cinnamate dioxygenase ferredoxin component